MRSNRASGVIGTTTSRDAASLRKTTEHTVLRIAMDVGYESEAAFSRAFKREMGEPPARYRRAKRAASRP